MQLKQVNVENVSPTLGKDQLHAGIVAGIIGLALVALYMLVFYRLLGLVVIVGILLSGMALYTLIAWILPEVLGLTIVLTLAGVTGIIVSVGITVDSYIVYFERMKDEVRAGRDRALVGRPRVHPLVPHDRRRRPRVADRRGGALLARHRLGARLRVLPRPLDHPRPARRVLLHAPARVAHGSPRRAGARCRASASPPGSTRPRG